MAGGMGQSQVFGHIRPAIGGQRQYPDPGVLRSELVRYGKAVVLTLVVHQNEFQIAPGLVQDGLRRFAQSDRGIKDRHDHRHQWPMGAVMVVRWTSGVLQSVKPAARTVRQAQAVVRGFAQAVVRQIFV